jgi:hypothetical protein
MLQILYLSTAREDPTPELLETILAGSRRNNRSVGITGLLIAGGRRFLQALEGPEAAVLSTMERIVRDPRHFALMELSRRIVDCRAFGEWEMAYRQGGEAAAGEGTVAAITDLIRPIRDRNLQAQFASFAELQGASA